MKLAMLVCSIIGIVLLASYCFIRMVLTTMTALDSKVLELQDDDYCQFEAGAKLTPHSFKIMNPSGHEAPVYLCICDSLVGYLEEQYSPEGEYLRSRYVNYYEPPVTDINPDQPRELG